LFKSSENYNIALQENSFVNRLFKSFLNRTEIRQYVEQIFASTFEKVYNFRAIPQNLHGFEKSEPNPKLQTKDWCSFSETELNKLLNPVLPQDEGKPIETMKVYELFTFCDEIMSNMSELLSSMPQSIRFLLKTIEIHATKSVFSYCLENL